jgi:hypothetical protein
VNHGAPNSSVGLRVVIVTSIATREGSGFHLALVVGETLAEKGRSFDASPAFKKTDVALRRENGRDFAPRWMSTVRVDALTAAETSPAKPSKVTSIKKSGKTTFGWETCYRVNGVRSASLFDRQARRLQKRRPSAGEKATSKGQCVMSK